MHTANAATNCAPIRTVEEANRIVVKGHHHPMAFDFTGTMLSTSRRHDENAKCCIFFDGTDGAEMFSTGSNAFDFARGERVHIRGQVYASSEYQLHFKVEHAEKLGRERLPDPVSATGEAIANGSLVYRSVKARGVVQSVLPDDIDPRFAWIILRTEDKAITASVSRDSRNISWLESLLDAEVEMSGLAMPFLGWRQPLGMRLMVTDDDELAVLKPAPDPFAAPKLSNRISPHRQREEGRVVAVAKSRFFMRTSSRHRLVSVCPVSGQPQPRTGNLVTASGFAAMDPFRIQLQAAVVRIDSPASYRRSDAKQVDVERLFGTPDGREKINTELNGAIICLSGKVVSTSELHERGDGVMRLECGRRQFYVDASAVWNDLAERPEPGCVVDATGLCVVEFEDVSPGTAFPRFRRFTIVPRDADDVRIAARPPWWTPLRLLILVAALVAVLAGLGVWNFMLNRKAERRGRELYDEKIGHALAEQKVEERTRLAVELHDSVSQTLTGVALQLDGGEIDTAKTMLAACRGELRRCLWDLRSRTFEEEDLTEAVERTIAPHLNGAKANVRFNVPRERLSETTVHAVLRIVRELVVNAIRHGGAKHVKIAGECHDGTISFSVRDDGAGFDPATAPGPEQGHFGLLGVRERLEDFNGELKVESEAGKGAKATVTMTLHDDKSND